MVEKKFIDLLYLSFDRQLTSNEQKILEEALAESEELQKEKQLIASLQNTIAKTAVKSFEPWFAERVINKIAALREKDSREEIFWRSLLFRFRRVALISSIIVISLLFYNAIISDYLSLSKVLGIPEVTIAEITDPLNCLIEE